MSNVLNNVSHNRIDLHYSFITYTFSFFHVVRAFSISMHIYFHLWIYYRCKKHVSVHKIIVSLLEFIVDYVDD